MAQIPRLYVDQDLREGQTLSLTRDAAHYLFSVMRLSQGAAVDVFNGRDGAWSTEVALVGKRGGELVCRRRSAPQGAPPDLWLLFAPVKKAQTDFIVEKAVEMGVARLCPVVTDFTNSERLRHDKVMARVIEAAEQCGISYVPQVDGLQKLSTRLDHWPDGRQLMFCDEARRDGASAGLASADLANADLTSVDLSGVAGAGHAPWAILIGPEGGFSQAERARLGGLPFAHGTALGPRILRAETAAVAALALWQMQLGDWQ